MERWVALFRGINVGTAKRVPMAELRKIMGALGYGPESVSQSLLVALQD